MKFICRRFCFGEDELNWNNFVAKSKNTTFLFNRGFMDYHKDKFKDFSLLVYNDKGNIVACFPANEINKNTISSHSGLTYGAIILEFNLKLPVIIAIYREILKHYNKQGYQKIIYKAFPRIYNKIPSDEIDYCLFLSEAKLWRRDTAIVVDLYNPIKYSGNIKREARKAKESGVCIQEDNNFKDFWDKIITPYMRKKFNVNPVHSYSEIQLLKNSFPNLIKLYVAKNEIGQQIAGTVIFEIGNTVHCQYISSTNEGRDLGALNFLFTELLDNIYRDKHFFDFGTANKNDGKELNYGLLGWKERMGGRAISHDFYEIITSSYNKLNSILS